MNRYPYAVCPDSGNEYAATFCFGFSICSCGCNRNLNELLDEQVKNGSLTKITMFVNTTKKNPKVT